MRRWRAHKLAEPQWPRPRGSAPRAVVEHFDPGLAWAYANVLDHAGWEVATCPGPRGRRAEGGSCPLRDQGHCPLVDGADLIVWALHLGDAGDRGILAAHRTQRPDTPLCVELLASEVDDDPARIAGCPVIVFPPTREAILEAVHAASS